VKIEEGIVWVEIVTMVWEVHHSHDEP